jgi:Ca2+:H+ antiporter
MCSITAATVSFVMIPGTLYATLADFPEHADDKVFTLSKGISILLLILYTVYMKFRLQPRADFLDERIYVGQGHKIYQISLMPFPEFWTLCLVVITAYSCAGYLIESSASVAESIHVNQATFSVIILPLVFSCAELSTAVFFTYENTMDLAINVVMGSAIQVPLLIMPSLVILGWMFGQPMTLHFQGYASILLFLSVFIVVLHVQEAKSTYVACAICWST